MQNTRYLQVMGVYFYILINITPITAFHYFKFNRGKFVHVASFNNRVSQCSVVFLTNQAELGLCTGKKKKKKYFHKSWREGVRHRAKRLFLGLPLARAVRLSYQRTYSLHEPRVLAIYSSPSLTEIVVLPKLRKKRDLQL